MKEFKCVTCSRTLPEEKYFCDLLQVRVSNPRESEFMNFNLGKSKTCMRCWSRIMRNSTPESEE